MFVIKTVRRHRRMSEANQHHNDAASDITPLRTRMRNGDTPSPILLRKRSKKALTQLRKRWVC